MGKSWENDGEILDNMGFSCGSRGEESVC